MKRLPLYFFPTKVIFVDDNSPFIEALTSRISKEYSSCNCFEDLNDARRILNELNGQHFVKEKSLNEFDSTKVTSEFSFSQIASLVDANDKYEEISVIVSDYDMPQENGLDFLESIESPNVRKLMLTGKNSDSLALEALGEGLINRYLRKDRIDLIKALDDAIFKEQLKFFTSKVSDSIYKEMPFLTDEIFIDEFLHILKKHHLVEFYLLDKEGTFCMKNKKGETKLFIVRPDDYMEAMKEELRDFDFNLTGQIFYFTKKSKQGIDVLDKDIVSRFIFPCKEIKAKKKYFYAFAS